MAGLPILYISKSKDGHMGVSAVGNRDKFFKKIGMDPKKVVDIVVTHSDKVLVVGSGGVGKYFEGFDAVITDKKDIVLGLTVADCLPIAVFDPVTCCVGLIHAGWRGLANGIIEKTIDLMHKKLKTENCNLVIFIGPHICLKHYEVKSDVSRLFIKYPGSVKKIHGKEFLDLGMIALIQLTDGGIPKENIRIDSECTFENPNYFSFRHGNLKERNLYLLTLLRTKLRKGKH